jgi:DNA polymerase-3 subunit delta
LTDLSTLAADKPVVYILHGDDDFSMERVIDSMIAQLGDANFAELNISRLDGRLAGEEELRSVAYALPMWTSRRLVVLSNPLARISGEAMQEKFKTLLDGLPDSTALVLLIDDQIRNQKWEVLHPNHWLLKWAQAAGKRVFLRDYLLPRPAEMPVWITRQTESMGGSIEHTAALALADLVGSETRLANQEITKLLTYVDYQRPVTAKDVAALCAPEGQADIFGLVDSLALGDAATAQRKLHTLLDKTDPGRIFPMVIRQFRLLIITRELLDEGGNSSQLSKDYNQAKWVANKLVEQAGRFSIDELKAIYHRLLEMDKAMKSSRITLELGLETFIIENSKTSIS